MGSFGPKYQRIADEIRRDVQAGTYPPGGQLPAETALAERFRVSVPTIRQALGVLRVEGVLESRQGIGTFVKETRRLQRRSRHRYGRARSDKQLLTSHLRHEIVFAGHVPAPDYVAECMRVEPGTDVVVRKRVLHNKDTDRVEEIGASYISGDIATGTYLEDNAVVPKALFLCIEDLSGKSYHHAHDQWIARSATPEEALAFDLPQGSQVIHVLHTAVDGDGTVLEVSESAWPADRVVVIDDYEIARDSEEPTAPSEI